MEAPAYSKVKDGRSVTIFNLEAIPDVRSD